MRSWVKSGSPWIWLTAASVAISLLALIGILLLLAGQGTRYFWPSPVYQFELNQTAAGPVSVVGELYQRQTIRASNCKTPVLCCHQGKRRALSAT